MARFAGLLTRNIQPHLSSFDCLPEINAQAVFEIGTFFRGMRRLALSAAKELAEYIAETASPFIRRFLTCCAGRAAIRPRVLAEVESFKAHTAAATRTRA